ncbi:uncharacterized protein [Physcomitrium patens]|nr:uncharacterized protein LOC112288159 isoform X2 [Physcomitrium patens]|eukprot:XP_024387813.1 uncharacterized protein LOC112288159 isoform X2 [Physcomitrella patens]
MKSMLQKSLLGNWTFVRTICRGSEVSDAAWAVEKILEYVSKEKEAIYCQLSPIARLHVWRLMPTRLKEDLSDLANESMRRPLLSLKLESGTFRAFGFMVASLALAPDLLNEVRRLLLIWSSSVCAVRLLELRAQLTVAVHSTLQYSSGSTTPEGFWLHAVHCSGLRPFLQVLTGAPTISALRHLVELMERRDSGARTAEKRAIKVPNCERSPKRQRRNLDIADEDQALDSRLKIINDASTNNPAISRAEEEASGVGMEAHSLATDSSSIKLHTSISGSLKGAYIRSSWAPLADFLHWSSFASQLLFQHEGMGASSRRSAADFLGWLLCPSSAERRASVITDVLQAAEDWHSMCNERKAEGTQTLRSDHGRKFLDLKYKNETENLPSTLCSLCGAPVNCSGHRASSGTHCVPKSSQFQNLIAWLLRLCSLGRELQSLHLEDSKNDSKRQSYHDGWWRVIRTLPIASISSDANFWVPQIGGLLFSMILLGISSWSEVPLSSRSCCAVCEDLHCVSCCSVNRHNSSEPPHRTEHLKDDARIEDDLSWVPFASALVTHLDTNFCVTRSAPPAVSDCELCVRRFVAACVHHWVQLMNQSTGRSPQFDVGIKYDRRVQILEDLHTRVIAWANSTGAGTELAQAFGDLKFQTQQFKAFL